MRGTISLLTSLLTLRQQLAANRKHDIYTFITNDKRHTLPSRAFSVLKQMNAGYQFLSVSSMSSPKKSLNLEKFLSSPNPSKLEWQQSYNLK